MLLRPAKAGLAGRDGEIQPQFPQRVARALVFKRIHFRIVEGEEQQIAFGPQQVQRGEPAGNDPHRGAFRQDAVPDHPGILPPAENLIAALAGIAGARQGDRLAEQRGPHMREIGQGPHTRNVFFQIVHRQRPLQRQVVQLVVKAHRHIAPRRGHGQLLVPLTRAMNHRERIRPKAVDHAIIDELAGVVQHAGVNRAARHQLFDVARRGAFDDMGRRRPGDMNLFQPRHIHQPGLGADRQIFQFGITGIGPRRAHARPVLKVGTKRAVTVDQRRESPGICHRKYSPCSPDVGKLWVEAGQKAILKCNIFSCQQTNAAAQMQKGGRERPPFRLDLGAWCPVIRRLVIDSLLIRSQTKPEAQRTS